MGRNRAAGSDGSGSLDIIAERITGMEGTEPILSDEPEIRIPQADRAMVETLKGRDLNVRYTERGVVVTLPDVVFEFGSTRLTNAAHQKLRNVAQVLLDEARGRAVAVEGHTDSIGAELYNQGLSERRAASVAESLSKYGVSNRLVSTRGYGSQYPITPNEHEDGSDNPDGRTLNRRVEIVIAN
jgi:outer membrane protein OmpA-like peptidoglycan-associated protein